ncbi:hypothetical protein H9W90_00725 [Polaribacter pectinis]|uniref:Lipoprotein n=1 Tax=Polaribacter pectinis TaxID=2738844 RepID=A0A7G9LAN2_9FLAO|nr:hypothetical protein [Polaribacter pectinis]QNM85681.1 hypothetical protein H9W90_00725 [Polaribacter pectinis]
MKKILLSMLVVGALVSTSCKNDKKEMKDTLNETTTEMKKDVETKMEETKEEVSNMVDSAIEGVKIPKFEDEKVTEFLTEYADYAKTYIDNKGDVIKNSKLAKEGVAFANKSKEIVSNLDEKAAAQFKSVMNAIQSKMAPAK